MKKIFKYLIVILFFILSIYYTEQNTNNLNKKTNTKQVVNLMKSKDEFIRFTANDNKKVSILLILNNNYNINNILKIINDNNIKITIYINKEFIEKNISFLKETNHEIELLIEDNNTFKINKNYLDINPIVGINNKKIELNDYINNNEITVLVPIKFNIYENDIKKTISDDYTGIYNKDNLTPPNVNIIYVKDNQSYFTFSTNMAQNNNYEIIDPIAVIVNSEFDPRILALNVSMGYGYYTKNSENISPFKLTQDTLKKYSLEESWQPISVAYSNVELSIENKKEWLELSKIYCLLFIILAAILLFFSLMYYLEINKKTLAIQWIFGYTFLEKHYLAYLFMLVFWNFIFAISFVKSNQTLLLAKIILVLILFDIILISIILSIKEYSITKKILIDK